MAELYVDGAWSSARSGARREIRCPADGSLVAEVDEAGAEDTAAAIAAAHRAFHEGTWPGTPAGSSTPGTPTWSAGSSTSRWASAD